MKPLRGLLCGPAAGAWREGQGVAGPTFGTFPDAGCRRIAYTEAAERQRTRL